MKKITFLLFLTVLISGRGFAAEPSSDPILRLETGMHTYRINSIGVDSANRYLVTSSPDKTVRIWLLSTGRLLETLHPPIGSGSEGSIFTTAISPDGSTIACGGITGYEWEKTCSIYIFDRETGRLFKRIKGLPGGVMHLTYSRDGRFLAATLGINGIRVFSTSDYSLVAEDSKYKDQVLFAVFDSAGRLATTSLDGYIRLYSAEIFSLLEKRKGRDGGKPYHISFSPTESRMAVGYLDSPNVDVLSGENLSYQYSPDTTGATDNGSFYVVNWSSDGSKLYAGGIFRNKIQKTGVKIRIWQHAGRGSYSDVIVGKNTISQILPLVNGGVVYGTCDPAFGILDTSDKCALFKESVIADFRENYEGFLVSYDGGTVQFGYEYSGKSPASFSVTDRQLNILPANSSLFSPRTSAPGITITDWKDTDNPKLNGKVLKLLQGEKSTSISVSPDNSSVLLGTQLNLILFDRNGSEKWKVFYSYTWGVNISGDGKLAVVAYSDGTIRWHRMSDGKELLAFFPHNDKKRWVLWTPSGYYDASAGAEELIGWHVNNGSDREADFFPVSRFRESRYRPDIIDRILSTLDETEAVRLADTESGRKREQKSISTMFPPVVTIVSPPDFSEVSAAEVTIRYSLRSPSIEPVTGIRALVDGRPVSVERGIKKVAVESDVHELHITIPERDCEITVIAENRFTASVPATVRLKWTGRVQCDEFVIKPKLYVLSVGVSKYDDSNLALGFAAKDAIDFATAMESQKDGLYRDVTVALLTDGKATKDNILDGLDWIQRETTSKDVAMVFLAGHGLNDTGGIYYFLPVNTNLESLKRTGLPFSDIRNTVSSLAGKTLFFVDTCHSGNVMGTRRGVADINGVVNELASAENGAVVFASSTGRQYSLEDASWDNGAFTKALVEGVNGRADYSGKGRITINMLDLYLSERVKELTGGKQTPTTTKPQTIQDFPIAVQR